MISLQCCAAVLIVRTSTTAPSGVLSKNGRGGRPAEMIAGTAAVPRVEQAPSQDLTTTPRALRSVYARLAWPSLGWHKAAAGADRWSRHSLPVRAIPTWFSLAFKALSWLAIDPCHGPEEHILASISSSLARAKIALVV